ncbi:phosphoribosylanthranilate isomerase [Halomarina litorea]|uniref:phosphoribosylanthranilate isomerase n=1 Tax=Halomarina litorea TaxID=2961595 RepID=UPI0020C47FC3|nr:phosphoribosylanthranilate isomerase [Halomarina sp. BCD28]
MVVRVKLCGVTTDADRDAAVEAGADAIGVVCGVPIDTPREVTPARARALVADAPPFVTTTLVTMPDDVTEGVELVERVRPDAVQVHAASTDLVAALASDIDAKVVAAVDLADDVAAYAEVADAVLVDSTDESGAGGTGETHDWERTRVVADRIDVPLILAGGLTPENVAEAVGTVRPYAADVSSGIEGDEPGRKDHATMRAFVEAARGAL